MKRFAIVLLLLILLVVPVGTALAVPPFDTVVDTGETVNNDVIVLDGNVDVKEGASVNGDVTIFNGNARIAGTVNGDLVLFNGNLEADSTAVITGECVLLNGNLADHTDSNLRCTNVENLPQFLPALSALQLGDESWRNEVTIHRGPTLGRFVGGIFEAVASSLLLGFLAFVVASLLPNHVNRVEETIRHKPLASGAVGLLTAVAIPSLVALLLPVSIILTFVCIGLLGFPIMFALLAGLAVGALLGWITVGSLVGQRLAKPLKLKNRSLPVTAALGTLVLTFVINLVGAFGVFPFTFAEGVATSILLFVGLGAVALTQFGTKGYPPGSQLDSAKVTAVLETLPVEAPAELKNR